MGGFIPGADVTGSDELQRVRFERRPPETTTDKFGGSMGPGVASETATMAPFQDLGSDRGWDIQTV